MCGMFPQGGSSAKFPKDVPPPHVCNQISDSLQGVSKLDHCSRRPSPPPQVRFARQGGSPGDLKKIKCAGNLGFRTNRYMGVRDSDRIPARRGGFERAARFPSSASVALQNGTESELLPFCLDSVLLAKWAGAALTETFPGVGAGGSKKKKRSVSQRGRIPYHFRHPSGTNQSETFRPRVRSPWQICLAAGSGIRVDPPCSAKLCFAN